MFHNYKVTFLGTGSSNGTPMIACPCAVCHSTDSRDKRLRTSILVQNEDTTFVIDTTPDFRFQMLNQRIQKLDAVLISHPHKDHIAGLDDVRPYNYFQQQSMPLFCNDYTLKEVKREFYYAFEPHLFPGMLSLDVHIIDKQAFEVGTFTVIPIQAWHHKMPVLGFRVHDFTYITDANRIDEDQFSLIKGTKTLVLNALRQSQHIAHFSLEEAIAFAEALGVENLYITHISHQMGLYDDVQKMLPDNCFLAYDGLELIF